MVEKLKTLFSRDLTPLIHKRQYGQDKMDDYSYLLDTWFFAFSKQNKLTEDEAVPLANVRQRVDQLLDDGHRLVYWSGGFDLGFHSNTMGSLPIDLPGDVKVVVGVEPNGYIEAKGRKAQFDQITRLSAVGIFMKQEGVLGTIFPVPEREGVEPNTFYDKLVKKIGMYRRAGCFHLYTENDPNKDIKIERMVEPEPWCCLRLLRDRLGRPFSTTRMLGLE